jgi:hypothetical protein
MNVDARAPPPAPLPSPNKLALGRAQARPGWEEGRNQLVTIGQLPSLSGRKASSAGIVARSL